MNSQRGRRFRVYWKIHKSVPWSREAAINEKCWMSHWQCHACWDLLSSWWVTHSTFWGSAQMKGVCCKDNRQKDGVNQFPCRIRHAFYIYGISWSIWMRILSMQCMWQCPADGQVSVLLFPDIFGTNLKITKEWIVCFARAESEPKTWNQMHATTGASFDCAITRPITQRYTAPIAQRL